MPLNILVVGLGGIGSIYSLLLRRASIVIQQRDLIGAKSTANRAIRLSFVARSNYSTIASSGINISSAKFGNETIHPDAIYRTTQEAADSGQIFDYVICTTKSLPNQPTVDLLRPLLSKTELRTTVVLIQNGLGIERPVHEEYPEHTIISATAYIGVWQTSPGFVTHSSLERLEMGSYPDKADSDSRTERDFDSLTRFCEILRSGGSTIETVKSMDAARWRKLIWNASFNPVCTIANLDTNQLTASPPAKALVMSAMHEIIETANKAGHDISYDEVEINWENTRKMNVAYKPSMMLDCLAGREMEVDVILGGPISEAERLGIEVPTLKGLRRMLDVYNWKIQEERRSPV